jgi:RNA polymerase sigma-70 factor (ECF subfamily)
MLAYPQITAMHEQPDEVLIERAARGDREAFSSLYDKYVDKIYRHVYYKVTNQADAEDITQEVFVRAWRAIPRYRKGQALFISWLLVIARNLITDFYRSRKKQTILEEENMPSVAEENTEATVERIFSRSELKKAISRLPGTQRTVIEMHFIDGFSYAEISRTLGKTEGAVRVIQFRALVELRKTIRRDKGGRE